MTQIDVLDKGYVRLRDVMGDDLTVVDAARVSFDKKSEWVVTDWCETCGDSPPDLLCQNYNDTCDFRTNYRMKKADKRLLKYLAEHNHWSPFSHPHVMLEIKAPVMVVNQLYKHRIGARFTEASIGDEGFDDPWNEMSGRYVSEDLEFYVPTEWRSAPANRKQGSGENLSEEDSRDISEVFEHITDVYKNVYDEAVNDWDVAPEQARLFLPYAAMYTKLMWTPSLYTLLRTLELRFDEHAQWEIRQYAQAIYDLVQPKFPESFDVFGLAA